MDTMIGYLGQVREDLMDAAFNSARRAGGRVPRRPLRLPSAGVLVPVGAALVLVVAGGLGWFVTAGPLRSADEDVRFDRVAGATGPAGTARENNLFGATPVPASIDYTMDHLAGLVSADEQANGVVGAGPRPSILTPSERIVRTAQLTLQLPPDSFDERFASAQDVAELHGGFVETSTGRERAGTLVMRVPSGEFAAAMRDLRALGEVEVQTVRGQDVTADYVDLQARLRIAKSRREVLLVLMAKAISIEQTIRVQNALDDTQLRIEELQGALQLLEDRTSFATIRVQLHEEGVEPQAEVRNPSVTTAWDRAIAGFFGVIAGVIVGLGYLLPILAIGLALWLGVRFVRRRRRAA